MATSSEHTLSTLSGSAHTSAISNIIKPNLAIEILIYDPRNGPESEIQRGVMVNPRLKARFETFMPIGVYIDEAGEFQYYHFNECDNPSRKTYKTLETLLAAYMPVLDKVGVNPKFFVMGHAHGGYYGMGNYHGSSEQLHDGSFDTLIDHCKSVCTEASELYVTLEGCNTDSQINADSVGQAAPFLVRLSKKHQGIIFGGSSPWDHQKTKANASETGYRSLSPNSPITSMVGNVWKAGNSIIFHHNGIQIRAIKSLFASTQSAMALKSNTVKYALTLGLKEEEILAIALRRDIQTIQDLKKVGALAGRRPDALFMQHMKAQEQIVSGERTTYVQRVTRILAKESVPSAREIAVLLLGLKDTSVFNFHPEGESVLSALLSRQDLLNLAMVSCGKVLVGGATNDHIINFLIKNGADINATDEKGMSALHYAVQNFYNYRDEPLHLIHTLLSKGANNELTDGAGKTPKERAAEHTLDPRVSGGNKLLLSLQADHSFKSDKEVKQAVRSIFQMDEHIKQQMLSRQEYVLCEFGTLFMPQVDMVRTSLMNILQRISDSSEFVESFLTELSRTVDELEKGSSNTGLVLEKGEPVQKCFTGVSTDLDVVYQKAEELGLDIGIRP